MNRLPTNMHDLTHLTKSPKKTQKSHGKLWQRACVVATSGQVIVVPQWCNNRFLDITAPARLRVESKQLARWPCPVGGMEATAANRTSATNIQQGNQCLPTIQSVSQACTPYGAKQRFGSLLTFPQLIVWTCFFPINVR